MQRWLVLLANLPIEGSERRKFYAVLEVPPVLKRRGCADGRWQLRTGHGRSDDRNVLKCGSRRPTRCIHHNAPLRLILGERIGWQRGLGIAMTFVGAITVMWDPSGFTLSVGLLFVVANAFCTSLGAVMIKQMSGVRPLQLQAWVGLSSVIPLAALSALSGAG